MSNTERRSQNDGYGSGDRHWAHGETSPHEMRVIIAKTAGNGKRSIARQLYSCARGRSEFDWVSFYHRSPFAKPR